MRLEHGPEEKRKRRSLGHAIADGPPHTRENPRRTLFTMQRRGRQDISSYMDNDVKRLG